MIFVTVGHQMPFDRLVALVDDWAANHPDVEVFAQIGAGRHVPQNFSYQRWLTPAEFESTIDRSQAVVAHAGTGTIIQVLLRRKPMLVLPRLASQGETRNDHQVGTARYFSEHGLILAACDAADLSGKLSAILDAPQPPGLSASASPELLDRLRRFANEEMISNKSRGKT
ncbi:MAG: glycosyltransferase [Pseudomonadales bacterium]